MRQPNMARLREMLCGKDKMPLSFCGTFEDVAVPAGYGTEIALVATVIVEKGIQRNNRKSSKHRVFLVCPNCGKTIPAGRIKQHFGTGNCQKRT